MVDQLYPKVTRSLLLYSLVICFRSQHLARCYHSAIYESRAPRLILVLFYGLVT